eukprot:Hpha_TRINITY_DN14222_c0_g3::TRINITY_DN14222_c0_g3_i1::g.22790::m.22790
MSAEGVQCPQPPNTARHPGVAGIPCSSPRPIVGFRGVRRLGNANLPRDPLGSGTRLQDLCEGVTSTDNILRTRGVARGPLSARAFQGTEQEAEKVHLRPAPPKPPPPTEDRGKRIVLGTGEAARGAAPAGREWEPMGKRPVPGSWQPSAELPEFPTRRSRQKDPPQVSISKVDRLQKEADQRALLALNAEGGATVVTDEVTAAGSGGLPRPKAGAAGSVFEPMRLALEQSKEHLRGLQSKAVTHRDNVRGLLGGGGGVQIGPPPPVPSLKLPLRVKESVRPRPPYQQENLGGQADFIMPARVSSMFPVFKDGDATAPRSDYRRRLMHPMDTDHRPAWH